MTEIPQGLMDQVAALDIRFKGDKKTLSGRPVSYQQIAEKVNDTFGTLTNGRHYNFRVRGMAKHGVAPGNTLTTVIIYQTMMAQGLINKSKGQTFGIRGREIYTTADVIKVCGINQVRSRLIKFTLGEISTEELFAKPGKEQKIKRKKSEGSWRGCGERKPVKSTGYKVGTWEQEALKKGIIRRTKLDKDP